MSVLIVKTTDGLRLVRYNIEHQYKEKVMSAHDALMLGLLLLPGLALSIAVMTTFAAGG